MKNLFENKSDFVVGPNGINLDAMTSAVANAIPDDLGAVMGEAPARMHQFFEARCDAAPLAVALVSGLERLTYAELDARANRLAHYLMSQGAGPGKTVGILLERSTFTYVSLLAVLKSGAAFVPIDPTYPADRVAFIAEDARLAAVLTTSNRDNAAGAPTKVIARDQIGGTLEYFSPERPKVDDRGNALAYIIYTSGTTGKPKGVAVDHSNICHFLSVCTPLYGVDADDRVYQGMTIAFDFSIEEIWPTWIAGATLVAGPNDSRRIGTGLADFLVEHDITILYCVPTLLATLDRDIPSIRTLIVGGEACPRDLVERWSRPDRRMLNTYGPTETTVTATWTELIPGKSVTIGRPLPGYRVYVLDEHFKQAAPGESGEICIGGLGVARGYVNRPELTAAKFVADPFEKDRLNARLYRSGDLGRFDANGDVEFLGRIDTQVKIRGFRIELGEIEAVLLEDAAVENAIVSTVPVGQPAQDIAAYIKLRDRAVNVESVRERLALELRRRVPVYMVPAHIEVLDEIPMLASGKADRKQLPQPTSGRLSIRSGAYVAPATALEQKLAAAWAGIFGREEISVEDDFFLDLGGHSLFAAQVISRLRRDPELRRLSVADLYANPTIRSLATFVANTQAMPEPELETVVPRRHSSARVWTAGVAQFGLLYGFLAILGAPFALLLAEHGRQRSIFRFTGWDLALPVIALAMSIILPVVLKWTLIGRFRAGTYPLWGAYFVRWWIVRKAFDFSPLHLLSGSPLLPLYARLLGAKIARGAHISTAQLHLPDLIEIGENASIGYEAEIQPFVVEGGQIIQAPVKVGANAFVGTKAMILAGAEIGVGARVAEQTLITRNQSVPAGESWSGSPARPNGAKDELLDKMQAKRTPSPELAWWMWAAYAVAFAGLEILPIALTVPGLAVLAAADYLGGHSWALAATPLAGLVFVLTTCLAVALGKRVVMSNARPGLYSLSSRFGLRKWVADKLMQISLTVTNTLYATLYTVPWLRALGARIGPRSEISTVSHIDPDLLALGTETFVADLASIGAATYHNGYVALARTVVGDRTFIGNASVVRGQTQMPDNCLIGVQSVAPVQPPQAGTSWLGSPAIFLPRRQSAGGFAEEVTYNPPFRLVAYRLFVEFFRIVLPPALLYFLGAVATFAAVRLIPHVSPVTLAVLMPGVLLASAVFATLIVAAMKWLIVGKYQPRIEPLWAPFVRHTEFITGLYESAVVPTLAGLLTGTPWVAPVLRLFGVHIGRRVYIETSFMTEFDLVRIGDDCSIGRATSLQTHLFEDRVMKMSVLNVGDRCTVGPRAVVLYDATLGDDTRLDALSLAMKGESLPPNTRWRGIPSKLIA